MSDRSSADTLEKILEVAEREFAKDGYEGAHLQHIASQVGVQKTAIYYYFPSKHALYEKVLARILERLDETVAAFVDRDEDPATRLGLLIDGINDLLATRQNYAQIVIRVFVDRLPLEGEELGPLVERVVGRLMAFFKGGQDAGVFAKASSRHLFQSAMGGMVFHYATGDLGALVLGVDDLFSSQAVEWRRKEVRRQFMRTILLDPAAAEA